MELSPPFENGRGIAATHGSPLFDFLTSFAPRKLKDLFRLCEYLYYNCAQVFATLQKFATYPVTTLAFDTPNSIVKSRYEKLHEKILRTRRHLISVAIDKYVYGNAFRSIYKPFARFLECDSCKRLTSIGSIQYKFNLKRLQFKYTCPHCQFVGNGKVIDRKVLRPEKIAVIRWDPKLMDIEFNPITGKSKYYYTIPKDERERVARGSKHLIDTLPMEYLKAIADDRLFEFAEGKIFHMKMDAPSGIEAQWGFPPLASTIKLFFYAATLRRANEAIALEYVVPMRIISPAPASGNSDPSQTFRMGRWITEMQDNIRSWRRDPLHIMWSPVPATVTHLGGQARALLTLGEVQSAEDNIIAALGLPKEFIYGGFSALGSGIQLRVLENQLTHQTGDLNDFAQWVNDEVASFMGWQTVPVSLTPFKLVDDADQKRLMLALAQPQGGSPVISQQTLGKALDFDPLQEAKQIKQETLDQVRQQQEMNVEIQRLQSNLQAQVQAAVAMGQQGMQYDAQAILAQADQLVQQLSQLDPGSRRSQMYGLETSDPVMYAVVKMRMEDMQRQQHHDAITQVRQSGNGAPAAAPAAPGGGQPPPMPIQ